MRLTVNRLALLLLQVAVGVGLAVWLWRQFSAPSARHRLPPRMVAVIVAGSFVVVGAFAATVAVGREELGTGLLLLIGAGAVVAAALRARDR
jgi:glycerol uptake facilitator-like aquaporin